MRIGPFELERLPRQLLDVGLGEITAAGTSTPFWGGGIHPRIVGLGTWPAVRRSSRGALSADASGHREGRNWER